MPFLDKIFAGAANDTGAAITENVQRLFAAVQNDNLPLMKSLLDAGVPVDARNELKETPLMLAVNRCHAALVNELLERKADPNATSQDNLTPLCHAAQMGHWDMVEQLALHGAEISGKNAKEFLILNALLLRGIEEKDSEQVSALKAAGVQDAETLRNRVFQLVAKNDAGGLEQCLINGVPENLRDAQGNTLLIKAVESGAQNVFDVLSGFGANADLKNNAGETALSLARKKRDNAMIAALMGGSANADPVAMSKEELQRALAAAVENGLAPVVESLLKNGASANGSIATGAALVEVAADKKYNGIVAQLLKAGADPARAGSGGIFNLAVAAVKSGDIEAVTRVLDTPSFYINTAPDMGLTYNILHLAADNDVEIARLIAQKDPCLVHRKEKWGSSPLRVALEKKDLPMVMVMLEAGADPRMTGKSPDSETITDAEYATTFCPGPIADAVSQAKEKFSMMEDIARGDASAVESALQNGVSPNLTDWTGKTGLYVACHKGYEDVVKALLKHGADPNLECVNGQGTPMGAAVSCGQVKIVRMLGDAGGSVMKQNSRGDSPFSLAEANTVAVDVTPAMRDALNYCRNLDIDRMSQQAVRLENKTTVMKPLKFKFQGQPQALA